MDNQISAFNLAGILSCLNNLYIKENINHQGALIDSVIKGLSSQILQNFSYETAFTKLKAYSLNPLVSSIASYEIDAKFADFCFEKWRVSFNDQFSVAMQKILEEPSVLIDNSKFWQEEGENPLLSSSKIRKISDLVNKISNRILLPQKNYFGLKNLWNQATQLEKECLRFPYKKIFKIPKKIQPIHQLTMFRMESYTPAENGFCDIENKDIQILLKHSVNLKILDLSDCIKLNNSCLERYHSKLEKIILNGTIRKSEIDPSYFVSLKEIIEQDPQKILKISNLEKNIDQLKKATFAKIDFREMKKLFEDLNYIPMDKRHEILLLLQENLGKIVTIKETFNETTIKAVRNAFLNCFEEKSKEKIKEFMINKLLQLSISETSKKLIADAFKSNRA